MCRKFKIQNMQRAVVHAVYTSAPGVLLAEAVTLTQLHEFMLAHHVGPSSASDILSRLASWKDSLAVFSPALTTPIVPDEAISSAAGSRLKRKRGISPRARSRLASLGDNPREKRKLLRASLAEGCYIAVSAKQSRRTLHKLGSCFMVPGVDYFKYTLAGETLPGPADYDTCVQVLHHEVQG